MPMKARLTDSLIRFFSLTYAVTWICFLAAIALAGGAGSFITAPLLLLGTVAPSLVALGIAARAEGIAGMQAELGRMFASMGTARWYLFAVGYMAAIKLAAAIVDRLISGSWPSFGTEPWYIIVVAIAFSTPVQAGEEIGWRGYALPRLAERLGLARPPILYAGSWPVRPVFPDVPGGNLSVVCRSRMALRKYEWKRASNDADALGGEPDGRDGAVGRTERHESLDAEWLARRMVNGRILVDHRGVFPHSDEAHPLVLG
jgi:membrane protease YdiL (CAAX protease family)